jgi:DNA-binding NtrC family response regulator
VAVLGPEGPAAAIEAARPGSGGPSAGERLRLAPVDPAMASVERLAAQAAESDEPVLVLGETGTGKDLLVAELHRRSPRAPKPLVRLSAVEIDAEGPAAQAIARAAGGTLLLDEVSALSPRAQLALTQWLERGALAGVRVVATSNQDLEASVQSGTFRKDLFFRLARFRLDLPPLRERRSDIRAFTSAILAAHGIAAPPSLAVLDALERYRWPGNVRELEGALGRAAAASGGAPLQLEHLPPEIAGDASSAAVEAPSADAEESGMSLRDEMAALERRRILEALERHPTQTEAAKALGIPLRTFLNRMDALGIPRARKK